MSNERKKARKRLGALLLTALIAVAIPFARAMGAESETQCASEDRDVYAQAICLYGAGRLEEAAAAFSVLEEAGLENPETIKAHYFLARISMRRKQWSDASRRLIAIYGLDPAFYREWACDYLLGVCREKLDAGT